MKGLDLAEAYYLEHGFPMIKKEFGSYRERMAAGFVGPGSECFGFDDEISRDHDWGPGFCLWLTEEDYKIFGKDLQRSYQNLVPIFKGFGPREVSAGEENRTGVLVINDFYKTYTGLDHPPVYREWLFIPEQSLATCTNGRVFSDPLGEFSRWRERLIDFYPEDIRLKKIASRCITAAQAGQYNFERSVKRKEIFTARYSETIFCADILSLVFLLNKRYAPFYKWMHRAAGLLPILGNSIHKMISDLVIQADYQKKQSIIEDICEIIIKEMKDEGLTDSKSDFLLDHAQSIHNRIKDINLRGRLAAVI